MPCQVSDIQQRCDENDDDNDGSDGNDGGELVVMTPEQYQSMSLTHSKV